LANGKDMGVIIGDERTEESDGNGEINEGVNVVGCKYWQRVLQIKQNYYLICIYT
jgi:hypothetical protein